MRYFVIEPLDGARLPSVKEEVVKITDIRQLRGIDYDARNELISDRLKLLMGLYVPKHEFAPVVFLDTDKSEQSIFWRFRPEIYSNYQAIYRNDGIVSHISFPDTGAPIAFTAKSPKGIRSIVVRLAVAESILRRGILGLKLTNLHELE